MTNLVYTAPGLTNRNLLERNLLGGWEVSGIFTLQSGKPFSIVGGAGNNNSGADQCGDRADVVSGHAPDPHSGSKQHWLQQYINPAAFQENAPGTFGDSGRNIFTAPRIVSADMSFDRNWEVTERYALQFRHEGRLFDWMLPTKPRQSI